MSLESRLRVDGSDRVGNGLLGDPARDVKCYADDAAGNGVVGPRKPARVLHHYGIMTQEF